MLSSFYESAVDHRHCRRRLARVRAEFIARRLRCLRFCNRHGSFLVDGRISARLNSAKPLNAPCRAGKTYQADSFVHMLLRT